MKSFRLIGMFLLAAGIIGTKASAQTWTPLKNQPQTFGPGMELLMLDGTVMVQDADNSDWFKLTPDNTGSYINGTWSQLASTPGFGPLYFASDVLADGRVFILGGEYNFGNPVWQSTGFIYDPVKDLWTPLSPPGSPAVFGDAGSVVLPDGTILLQDITSTTAWIFNSKTLTFTPAKGGKLDTFDEEGFTLLPDGSVLTVDVVATPNAERYIPGKGWVSAGVTPVVLPDSPGSEEMGPAVLRPDGTVFVIGATGHTAIYVPPTTSTGTGTWTQGPDFPKDAGTGQLLDDADGPAACLPSGNVLIAASPGVFESPTKWFEWDGTKLNPVPATPDSGGNPSFVYTMLLLPTGQVMVTDFSGDVEIYTPKGSAKAAWLPTVTTCPTSVKAGTSYAISGTQFNGLTQGAYYGDDSQTSTNYPVIRITNNATGHVTYCRTSGHSTMGLATGSKIVSTNFLLPKTIESGPSKLQVIANGVPSAPFALTVTNFALFSVNPPLVNIGSPTTTIALNGAGFVTGSVIYYNAVAQTTTFVSQTKVTFTLTAAQLAKGNAGKVYVQNPDGTKTATLPFTVGNPVPFLISILPQSVTSINFSAAVVLRGEYFSKSSTVLANGVTFKPTFVNSTELIVVIPQTMIASSPYIAINVVNPAPGGGPSGTQYLIIQ